MSKIEALMRSLSLDEQRIRETMQKLDAAGPGSRPVNADLILLGNGNAEAA